MADIDCNCILINNLIVSPLRFHSTASTRVLTWFNIYVYINIDIYKNS